MTDKNQDCERSSSNSDMNLIIEGYKSSNMLTISSERLKGE